MIAGGIEILLGWRSDPDRIEPGLFLLWRPFVLAALALIVAHATRAARATGYATMLAIATLGEAALTGAGSVIAPGIGIALGVGTAIAVVIDGVMRAGMAIGGRWLAAAALLLLLAFPGAGRRVAAIAQEDGRPVATGRSVAVLAGVPLRWAEGAQAATAGVQPVWRLFGQAFQLQAVDDSVVVQAGRWLLVQPRSPGATGLVAIDTQIRRGAHAVILTDPDLRWPTQHAPGDAAAPPRTATLAPLLRHWGLTLIPAGPGLAIREVGWRGRRWRLALFAPGRFVGTGPGPCRIGAAGLIARCTMGRGSATLLADADLLHPMLWADPDGGHAPADRPSDNAAFVAALLAGPDRITPPVRPVLWTECRTTCRSLGIVEP